MRAAVYNRFLASRGGGERHSGMLAQVLAEDGWQVDLVGHGHVDPADLSAHLGLDLEHVRVHSVPDSGEPGVERLSAGYDLFVNASYMSRARNAAPVGVYLCYFPTPFDHDLAGWQRAVARAVAGRVARDHRPFELGTGWFPPEGGLRRTWRWTTGDGALVLPAGVGKTLAAALGRPGATGGTTLRFLDDGGAERARIDVGVAFSHHVVTVGDTDESLELHLTSDTFVPGADDPRTLGVAVSRLRLRSGHESLTERLGERFPWLLRRPGDLAFLDSYDRVVANSEYTRGWIRRYWQRDSAVLFPPVEVAAFPPAPERRPVIASVGRFLPPGRGHCKKQLEMVRFFAGLAGQLPGWELHLLGGVAEADRGYLDAVRAAAAGLPVRVVGNAPRAEVIELLSTASLFWSATGYGENEDRRPWTSEHFGITTVEAMAGGCVPVVIDRAGQREIVRDGVDGYRWSTPAQLGERTLRLAGDADLMRRMSAAAHTRADDYGPAAFARRWREIEAALPPTHGPP